MSYYTQRHFTMQLKQILRPKQTIQLTSCKRFDNNCYHLQCIAIHCYALKMITVVSFALAVVFIIRLFSTSAFRVPTETNLIEHSDNRKITSSSISYDWISVWCRPGVSNSGPRRHFVNIWKNIYEKLDLVSCNLLETITLYMMSGPQTIV